MRLGEEFGVIVGDVDEDIKKELKLERAQGVAVFEVIGSSRADYAGIKVRSIIKEIDKTEIGNMIDFGRAIKRGMKNVTSPSAPMSRPIRAIRSGGGSISISSDVNGTEDVTAQTVRTTNCHRPLSRTHCGCHRPVSWPRHCTEGRGSGPADWVAEIEKIFIRSEDCKQCHDRHYEEWKGVREQTPDLKTFGRVDAALLHGTSLESPVFRTVLGVWLQTNPTADERRRCLSCHVPSTTVFPQHVEKIVAQVLSGKPQVEGIGCASCHLIKQVEQTPNSPPSFKIEPGKMIYGPYANPEENLVHPATQSDLFRGANYCASCHFDKVKDVTQKDLAGEILQGTICQDCHMEPSTGSSTSKRGAMTRSIGRHWFRGVVVSRHPPQESKSTGRMDAPCGS